MSARTLQELVSAAASLHPDRLAVTFAGGSQFGIPASLSYQQLDELSRELSRFLQEYCSHSGGGIGLYCREDVLTPVWVLGILQTGGAYVPLDPEADGNLSATVRNLKYCAVASQLLQQFKDTLIKHATVEVCEELPKFKLTLVQINGLQLDRNKPGELEGGGVLPGGHDEFFKHRDLAYVLHTSGTTGFPKTVRVPHKCILPNILHLRCLFQMTADDVVFLASPLTFDPSVVEIFLALSSGAQLLIVPSLIKKIPNRLAQLLFKDHKTTVLQVTPTLLLRFGHRVLKEDVLSSGSSLRVLALGGEACPSTALLRSWKHEDNKTQIYNIYGITEVSCWASCYQIPQSLLSSSSITDPPVPLGTPLTDTVLEVRGEDGCVVTDGEGQVFIGGEERVCLLDDEDALGPGTMRATGDWVKVQDTHLVYLGRRDRMIKRHGKRVNLDAVQQVILSLPEVESCAVALQGGFRLIAFIIAAASQEKTPTSSVLRSAETNTPVLAEHQEEPPSSGKHQLEETGGAREDLKRLIWRRLSDLLPSHSVPDVLLLVPDLSLNRHGKVDLKALMRRYERQRWTLEASAGDSSRLKQRLQALWQKTLGLPGEESVREESNFLFSGGDSLKALSLSDDILTAVRARSPQLLEIILDGTFSDVLRHIIRLTQREDSSEPRKRPAGRPAVVGMKRDRRDSTANKKLSFKVMRRAGDLMEVNVEDIQMDPDLHPEMITSENGGVGLALSWSSDTGKCVDASPVLLVRGGAGEWSGGARATVFIGSHSHRLQALDLCDGTLLWERVLGDRIEASAAVSHCGTLVILGCYDGCVYFLCSESGETRWVFETGDAVKSSPAVDLDTGLVVVGSHDGNVYALNPQVSQCVWKRHCGGGGVFASPRLCPDRRRLYVASLAGRLLCLNLDSGDVLWSHCRNVPFFSSPNCCSERVVIGSVDGNICCFDSSGKPLWQFLTEGPVFSSPCFTPDRQRLVCGSHDGRLYCLSRSDGGLLWSFQTAGRVFSSPCVLDGSVAGRSGLLVVLASTDGTVFVLDGRDGRMLASHKLPGELFSSPVVWGSSLVVGCRDDYVYCLKLKPEDI